MKLSRPPAALLLLLLIACEAGSAPPAPSEQVPATPTGSPRRQDLSFPGGGRILFVPSRAPGYTGHGVGIVEADGSVRRFQTARSTFPYWDPAASDRLLTLSYGSRPQAHSYEIAGDTLRLVGSWRTSGNPFTLLSVDGETISFTPLDRSGHPLIDRLRLVERTTGTTTSISSGGLVPLDWTPEGKLLAAPWSGGDLVVWDPATGATKPFGPSRLSSISWAPGGNRFAAVIALGREDPRGVVVIGAPDGHIVDRISVGRRLLEMPTWSPDGGRIAFIVRGSGRTGHRTASLHVYDVARRLDSVVARPVSDAFWASWSPDGRWLLVPDWTRTRWLFVAADGSERLPYPWLGNFPRWCCPSSPAWVPVPGS